MSKRTGLGMRVWIDGYALGGDFASLDSIQGGWAGQQDLTDVTQEANDRGLLQRTGSIEATIFFNDASNRAHSRFSPLTTTTHMYSLAMGTSVGSSIVNQMSYQIGYDPTRGADGSLTIKTSALSSVYGQEWCELLTAGERTDTGATAGAAFDGLAATAFGLQAYLQVLEFTGTDVTVKLQMDDNSGFTTPTDVTGGGFTQITGGDPLVQRIQTARDLAVERYLRVTTVTTGGFTSLTFVCSVAKNISEVLF